MLDRWTRSVAACAAFACAMLLAACSGGGGNGLSAPVITSQPASTTVLSGETATYSVTAAGTPAPTYQWRRNGVNIDGATTADYVTPAVVLADGGAAYTVAVSNSQGTVVSNDATLGVTAVTTAEKRSLIEVMRLTAELYLAALSPFQLMGDGDMVLEPTTVCQTGVGAAMVNGVPAFVGQVVPSTGTFAATFQVCQLADGTSLNGTTSVAHDFPNLATSWDGNATFTMTDMRRTTRTDGVVERDYTVNGMGTVVVSESSTATEDILRFVAAPTAGATLRNEADALIATFTAGDMDIAIGLSTSDELRVNYTWNNLANNIAGVAYVANGFYELNFDAQGTLTGGSGSVYLTADGVAVGRVYATAQGLFVEVDGVSQALKAPTRRSRR